MDSDWDEIRSEAERAVRRGKFDEASQLWLQAITLCNEMTKYDSRRIVSLEGLANVYWRTNQFADALPILVKTFSLHEDQLGPDHADIGVLANNLARVYHTLEKFPEAEALYQRALRIQRKVLGVEHADVAELIKNYANLLVASGRGFEAEDLKASTVSIKSGIWNRSGHFNTIQIDNPDSLYLQSEALLAPPGPAQPSITAPPQPQAQPEHSEPTLEPVDDSRAISDDEISAESSGLSNWLNARKATTYEAAPFEKPAQWIELISRGMEAMQQNNTLQAEQLLRKAVAATDTFEPTDPRIASTLELYSEALWKNGKLAEAQPICERTLQFYERTLDAKHQDIGVISNNLAMLYHALEKPELAEPMYKRALDIRTANQGTTHPDVITLLNNYANMLYVFHREGEAVNLKNYIRSLTSGKWNQVGKFKAMSPATASGAASGGTTAEVQETREDQFATFSRFMPSMDKVDWISQSSDVNPTLAEKKETNVKPDVVKPKTEMTEDGAYSNDPRAVLRSLVDGFKKKPGEK